jgi:hypothetical protein
MTKQEYKEFYQWCRNRIKNSGRDFAAEKVQSLLDYIDVQNMEIAQLRETLNEVRWDGDCSVACHISDVDCTMPMTAHCLACGLPKTFGCSPNCFIAVVLDDKEKK